MKEKLLKDLEDLLLPMEKLPDRIPNDTYFLTDDLLFVFAEGYTHPPGGLYGKVIYFPDPNGAYDYYGERYTSTFKGIVDGVPTLFSYRKQLAMQYKCDPSLNPDETRPAWAEYRVRFPLDRFIGFFDHIHSLNILRDRHPHVDKAIQDLARFLDRPESSFGATGSLAFGIVKEEEDLDLTFTGTVAENQVLRDHITEYVKDPEHRVIEFDKFWPMRFFLNDLLMCPFFLYGKEEEIPLLDMEMTVLQENLHVEGRVADDTHSIYMPVFLGMDELVIDGRPHPPLPLIIYDSSLRGDFFKDNRLRFKCRLCDVAASGQRFECFLVTITEDIERLP
jgi:hypothetical protein